MTRTATAIPEEKRLAKDEATLYAMAHIYCLDHHTDRKRSERGACSECEDVIAYANERTRLCPHQHKGNCEDCSIHCYRPEMRTRIRKIMAYAGPRMIRSHPLMALRYLFKKRVRDHRANHNRAQRS